MLLRFLMTEGVGDAFEREAGIDHRLDLHWNSRRCRPYGIRRCVGRENRSARNPSDINLVIREAAHRLDGYHRTFQLGDRIVSRMGHGAMQLTGPGVFGPPKDKNTAIAVLREAVAQGVNHIDTSDFYGPHITNQLIREALRPYPEGLTIVTKVGAKRGALGSVHPAMSRGNITQAVHDNLRNLGVDVLDVVNMRSMLGNDGPAEGSLEGPLIVLADLQRQGLVRHIGLSSVTPTQIAEGRRICEIVCVQNLYNVMQRDDDALIDQLAADNIAYMPYFPLGGLRLLESAALSAVAVRVGATPMQVALAWLLQRSPNILPIPGTGSLAHLNENLAAARLDLPLSEINALNDIVPRRHSIKQD
jgi:pyridoxine 4-dehydrogenase